MNIGHWGGKTFVVFLLGLFLWLTGCGAEKNKKTSAQNEIEAFLKAADAANTCNRDEDCALVLGKCPLPCHILVNRDKRENIKARMNTLFLQCLQECGPPGKPACRDGRCVMENQRP